MANSRNITKKEKMVLQRAKSLKYPTDRLGPGSLMTQQTHTNASRLTMVNSQLPHMVNIENADVPLVPTGFEQSLAKHSTMLDKSDGDYEVVAKFVKNAYNYILIGYDKKRKRYHAWKRSEAEEHSEGFATRYNNQYIDSLEISDTVEKDEYIKKPESFDKHMNYGYGRNLNTVYILSTKVLEDSILLMNGAERMMNSFLVYTILINLNDNEILLNWFGDDNHYQPLPNIGEKTRKGYVGVVRRVDNSKAPYALKKKKLRHIERGDRKYSGEGKVIDMTILYNKDPDKIVDVGANKMLREMYDTQQDYYRTVYDYMMGIVDGADDGGYTYSDEFTIICEESHDFVDASAFFADSNESVFGNMQIQVTIIEKCPLLVGSKLVGRYGNKGVISNILTPEKSWTMSDGTPIHVAVATLGIVGRLNQSQMNEHSINERGEDAIRRMKLTDDLDEKCKIIYDLMVYFNSDEASKFKKYYKGLDKDHKAKLCKQIERDGVFIVQDPIENANMFDIMQAYEEHPPNWQHIVFEDGRKSMRQLLCAKMFYMRLKQDPLEKYSARSRGPVNPLTTLPAKSNMRKKNLEPFSDVPVRVGESELEVWLAMCNHPAAVADFMTENSTSLEAKIALDLFQYLGDLDEDVDLSELDIRGKKNMESVAAHLNVLGTEIVIDYEVAPPGELFYD